MSSQGSSSSSGSKFKLDESSTRPIYVYQYRGGGAHISCEKDLCQKLDKDPSLRCSRKFIPRGSSSVEILAGDLLNEPLRTEYAGHPTQTLSIAMVGLPSSVYWRRLILNQFDQLYVISTESSPSSSAGGSPDASNRQ